MCLNNMEHTENDTYGYSSLTAERSEIDRQEEILSLCVVGSRGHGTCNLFRLADLEGDQLKARFTEAGKPITPGVRRAIYQTNGPDQCGAYGIWRWHFIENGLYRGGFMKSAHQPQMKVIRIFHIKEAAGPENVVRSLKAGVPAEMGEGDAIFATADFRAGVFLPEEYMIRNQGIVRVREKVFSLPVVTLKPDDLICFQQNISLCFYAYLTVRNLAGEVMVYDMNQIILSLVLGALTRKKFREETGGSNSDFKAFKENLSRVATPTRIESIQETAGCRAEEAEKYLEAFMDRVDDFITQDTLSEKYLGGIISRSSQTMEVLEKRAEQNFMKNMGEEIRNQQRSLSLVQNRSREAQDSLKAVEMEIAERKQKLAQVKEEQKNQIALGIQVRERVRAEIEKARADAAGFAASGVWHTVLGSCLETYACLIPAGAEGIRMVSRAPSIEDLCALLSDNLRTAGVNEGRVLGLSCYLLASVIENVPLLLVGPSGEKIACAASAALTGFSPLIVDCAGEIARGVTSRIEEAQEKVVLVRNPFETGWTAPLTALMDRVDKMFFLVYPFTEDLAVEPKSLYAYVLPLFTEALDMREGKGAFSGCDHSALILKERNQKADRDDGTFHVRSLMRQMRLPSGARLKICRVLSRFRSLYARLTRKDPDSEEMLLCLLPIAEAVEAMDVLQDVQDRENEAGKVRDLTRWMESLEGEDESGNAAV